MTWASTRFASPSDKYWTLRELVYEDSENFPNVNLEHPDRIIDKAASLDLFVVIDLHGAPFAQKVNDAFMGQVGDAWPAVRAMN